MDLEHFQQISIGSHSNIVNLREDQLENRGGLKVIFDLKIINMKVKVDTKKTHQNI